jgi:hypothetical protein
MIGLRGLSLATPVIYSRTVILNFGDTYPRVTGRHLMRYAKTSYGVCKIEETKKNSVDFSPQLNYTD